ncbi:hypothetical protein D3C76_1793260 [compost metagenome]
MRRLTLRGQKQKGVSQFNTVHLQGAVVEVVLQDRRHIVMEIAERFHQPGNGRIASRVFEFRPGNRRIVGNIADP